MQIPVKTGSPTSTVNFYTRDKAYEVHSKLGDPNSEILGISTSKDLGQPHGSFTLEMVLRKDSKGLTWDKKIEVFDFVEIKLKGISDTEEVVVMRGLVDDVTVREDYGTGIPQRSISISGRDLGSLLTDFNIYYYPTFNTVGSKLPPPAAAILRMLAWSENFKMNPNMEEAFDFFFTKWKEVIRLSVGRSEVRTGTTVSTSSNVITDGKVVRRDQVDTIPLTELIDTKVKSIMPELRTGLAIQSVIQYEGSFWNLFMDYADKPWHELFLWDAPSGVKLVVRPARLKDFKGNYQADVNSAIKLMGKDAYPDDIVITDIDKIGSDTKISNSQQFNFFFTFPEFGPLSKANYMAFSIAQVDKPWTCVNPWVAIKQSNDDSGEEPISWVGRYGLRQYHVSTKYFELNIGQLDFKEQKDPGTHPPPPPAALPQAEPSESRFTQQYKDQNPPGPGDSKLYLPAQLSRWESLVEAASQKYKVNREIIYAVMQIESNGNEKAKNDNFPANGGPLNSTDIGLMQINMGPHGLTPNRNNPDYTGGYDPALNIDYGTKKLKGLLNANGGDVYKAVAAYNGGQNRVNTAVQIYGTSWLNGLYQVPPDAQKTGGRVYNHVLKFQDAYASIRTGVQKIKQSQKGTSQQSPSQTTAEDSEYVKQIKGKFFQFSLFLNKILCTWYLHNHFLKEGSIQMRGTNKAVIGTYAQDLGDDMEYYIEGVSHNFRIFNTFTTNLRVTRGQPPKESGGLQKFNIKSPFSFDSQSDRAKVLELQKLVPM